MEENLAREIEVVRESIKQTKELSEEKKIMLSKQIESILNHYKKIEDPEKLYFLNLSMKESDNQIYAFGQAHLDKIVEMIIGFLMNEPPLMAFFLVTLLDAMQQVNEMSEEDEQDINEPDTKNIIQNIINNYKQ